MASEKYIEMLSIYSLVFQFSLGCPKISVVIDKGLIDELNY